MTTTITVFPLLFQPCRVCNYSGLDCHVQEDEKKTNSTAQSGVADADFVLYVSAIEGDKCTQVRVRSFRFRQHIKSNYIHFLNKHFSDMNVESD